MLEKQFVLDLFRGEVPVLSYKVFPVHKKFAPQSREFYLAVRLGVPMPFVKWVMKCDCGKSLDEYEYHFITCKSGG